MNELRTNSVFVWLVCIVYTCAAVGFLPMPISLTKAKSEGRRTPNAATDTGTASITGMDCGCCCAPGTCGDVCCCGLPMRPVRVAVDPTVVAQQADLTVPITSEYEPTLLGMTMFPLSCNRTLIQQILLHYQFPPPAPPGLMMFDVRVVNSRIYNALRPTSTSFVIDPPPPRIAS